MASKRCGKSPVSGSDKKAGCPHANKWCKALWYREGKSGETRSEDVPRTWVSRTRKTIKWPSHTNFQYANIHDKWTLYVLISCTHSVDTLEEAEELDISDFESHCESQATVGMKKEMPTNLQYTFVQPAASGPQDFVIEIANDILFEILGGQTENGIIMMRCISKVIQRPQVAQHLDCGGFLNPGSQDGNRQ